MGWFGIGDSKNPLDNIEVPKDQLPPEVAKPGSANDVKKAMQQGKINSLTVPRPLCFQPLVFPRFLEFSDFSIFQAYSLTRLII